MDSFRFWGLYAPFFQAKYKWWQQAAIYKRVSKFNRLATYNGNRRLPVVVPVDGFAVPKPVDLSSSLGVFLLVILACGVLFFLIWSRSCINTIFGYLLQIMFKLVKLKVKRRKEKSIHIVVLSSSKNYE